VNSFAHGVSADGRVVVGTAASSASPQRIVRWTAAGIEDLGAPGTNGGGVAHAASGDGTWIVGQSIDGFRWSAATGFEQLAIADAVDVSDDGSVIVGFGLRWRNGEVTPLVPGGCLCWASAGSRDGVVVVGWYSTGHPDPREDTHAFRWTDAAGLVDLGLLGEGREAAAEGTSANGSVIVGQARNKDGWWRAFRWTAGGGMVELGTLRNGLMSAASAVSADGSVVVGRSLITSSTGSERAFRWTAQQRRMEDVREALLARGVTSVQNWILISAVDVSADGRVIVGFGRNPSLQFEAWLAVLP
jgi:probable HAF family extracellular repeat protein